MHAHVCIRCMLIIYINNFHIKNAVLNQRKILKMCEQKIKANILFLFSS